MNSAYQNQQCIVCGGGLGSSGSPRHSTCKSCGFTTRSDAFSDRHFVDVFGKGYFEGDEYGDYLKEKSSLQANFRRRLEILAGHVVNPKRKKLFEIGCAHGFFLELAKDTFAAARGIDISPPAVDHARDQLGLDVHCGDYLQTGIAKGFDVFCLWDCIAHLKRPDLYVEKIASDIVPGGVLALTTGDVGSVNARLRGRNWRLMGQPTLFHHFSRGTMTRLLGRFGFRIVNVTHPGISRSVRAICRGVLGANYAASPVACALDAAGLLGTTVRLNLFDIMFAIAVKE